MIQRFFRPFHTPTGTALLLGLVAQILYLTGLGIPSTLLFDETHYVPAARQLIALDGPFNIEHPLLGKSLIAAGILLFGDNSLGWRFFSTLAGTATVLGIYAMLWLLTGRLRTAAFGGALTLLSFPVFIQARIGMLDGFMGAFVIGAIAVLLWAMRGPPRWVWPRWLLGAMLLGLAVGCKWAAVPYVAFAGATLTLVRLSELRRESIYAGLNGRDVRHWPGLPLVPALTALGVVSIATYALTFAPAFFYTLDPLTLDTLVPFHERMYAAQTQVLPPHTYQSSWWSWPMMLRPIWYLYERVDGAMRGVLLVGNPAVHWGGLVALLACLWGAARERSWRLGGAVLLWVGAFGVWAIIPKSIGFFYYYYLPGLFLIVALALAFDRYGRRHWDTAFLVIALVLFIDFHPIISAQPLSNDQAFQYWIWLPSWP